jgi:hypothetical protein
MALSGFGILGFANHAFWLLGMGLEAAYLYALSTNGRFQKVVDAMGLVSTEKSKTGQRADLIARLTPAQRKRLAALDMKLARILQIYQDQQSDEFTLSSNKDALNQLQWTFLKLMVAQRSLNEATDADPRELRSRIEKLQQEIAMSGITRTLRESKEATLQILQQRLLNFTQRAESNEEVESDLSRIEAQMDLALENATLQGRTAIISANIELTSNLLSNGLYGDMAATVSALDRNFSHTTAPSQTLPKRAQRE